MARLIWLMGASGSGKDSLLRLLAEQPPPRLLIAHRYITRDADAGGENHIALSPPEFQRRADLGLFAMQWQAHGYHYALGSEIDLWLEAGLDVLVNGSRLHLQAARERYGPRLLPLCLQVSPAILRQRLTQRGRESSSEIDRRLVRAAQPLPTGCTVLNNDGALATTLAQLQQLLQPEMSA